MAVLESICPSDGGSAVSVTVADCGEKQIFLILLDEYASFKERLKKGPVDGDTVEWLSGADSRCRAVKKGRALVEYGSNSRKGLVYKLVQRGFRKDAAVFAADRLAAEGFIDEMRDAWREAEIMISSCRGKVRILAELRAKGYGSEAVNDTSERLEAVDFSKVCNKLITKKWRSFPSDPELARKAAESLRRAGFSSSEIKAAIVLNRKQR